MVATNGSVHKIEASWDQFATGDLPAVSPARQLFQDTVLVVAAQAKAAMPHAAPRIDPARDLVLGGLVTRQHDGSFAVRSATAKGKTYVVSRDGGCECPDVEKLPDRRCKHLYATWIWRRARAQVEKQAVNGVDGVEETPATHEVVASAAPTAVNGITTHPSPVTPPPVVEHTLDLPPEPSPVLTSIPAWALVEIHGRQHVTFGGLLCMAHERGLTSLAAQFTTVTAELAIAEATATFADGRTFIESADSTPQNVNRRVAPHFPRVALTRSKARALRDALNIPLVSVEELES